MKKSSEDDDQEEDEQDDKVTPKKGAYIIKIVILIELLQMKHNHTHLYNYV